jgi:hypothetical protein
MCPLAAIAALAVGVIRVHADSAPSDALYDGFLHCWGRFE